MSETKETDENSGTSVLHETSEHREVHGHWVNYAAGAVRGMQLRRRRGGGEQSKAEQSTEVRERVRRGSRSVKCPSSGFAADWH